MQSSARESYLTTDVMTATPQKLQLMLIEAAIRSVERARETWKVGENEQACEALIRAQEIVAEMLGGLNRNVAPELVSQVASVYLFVFRSLMEANHQRSEKKLDDALRVLETERETWRQVCTQLGSDMPTSGERDSVEHTEHTDVEPPAVAGRIPREEPSSELPPTGLSLEA